MYWNDVFLSICWIQCSDKFCWHYSSTRWENTSEYYKCHLPRKKFTNVCIFSNWFEVVKAMFCISRNQFSLQFYIVKFRSCQNPVNLAISGKINQILDNFSLKITKSRENCQSQISQFPQMVKSEITLMLNSHKLYSQPITNDTVKIWNTVF